MMTMMMIKNKDRLLVRKVVCATCNQRRLISVNVPKCMYLCVCICRDMYVHVSMGFT